MASDPQVPDQHLRRSGDDHRDEFLELLPTGQAWPKEIGSVLWQSCDGLNQYWGFVDGRAGDLLERESDPRITVELLPDWERNWGLPDPCLQEPLTLDARHNMLMLRMTMLGAQSRAWFIGVAESLGYKIHIGEYSPWICGISRCGYTAYDDFAPPVQPGAPPAQPGAPPPPITGPFALPALSSVPTLSVPPHPALPAPPVVSLLGIVTTVGYAFNNPAIVDARGRSVVVAAGSASAQGAVNALKTGTLQGAGAASATGYLFAAGRSPAVASGAATAKGALNALQSGVAQSAGAASATSSLNGAGLVTLIAAGSASGVGSLKAWQSGYAPPAYVPPPPGIPRWQIAHAEIRFYWKIYVDNARLTWFRCGSGVCGVDPHLVIGLATDLECILNRWQPAHTEIIYDYSSLATGGSLAGVLPIDYSGFARATSSAIGVGQSTIAPFGSASATGVATGVGQSLVVPSGLAAAVGVAIGVGQAIVLEAGAAAGTGVASSVGRSTALTTGVAAGTSTATAARLGTAVGAAASTGVATGGGRSTVLATGAAVGAGVASAVIASAGVTLDPTQLGPSTVLSNGNLTATQSAGVVGASTLATAHHSTGKYYYEFTVGAATNTQIGIMNASSVRTEYVGFNAGDSCGVNWNGSWLAAGGTTTAPSFIGGHTYAMAFDLDAKKGWIKDLTAAGNWNADASANPVTGVNGATYTPTGEIYPAISLQATSDQTTFNFGASAYVGTRPSGYANWGGAVAGPSVGAASGTGTASAVGSGPSVTLDPTQEGPSIVLSNGNLTATQPAGATGNTLATAHASTGKYYYEFTVQTATNVQVGLMNAAGARSEYLGQDLSHSAAANYSGNLLSSGGVTTGVAFTSGHVYGMAIDLDNKKLWIKDITAASLWNANSTADPVAGINGATFATITGEIYPACSLNAASDQVTFNFGASAYVGTPPSGYVNWSSSGGGGGGGGGGGTLIWSDEFNTYPSVASTASGGASDTTSNWRYNAIWQLTDKGYRDFAGTSWNINPNDPAYAGYNPFSVSGGVLTIQAFRTPAPLVSVIRADLNAQGNSSLPDPAWCGGFLVTNSAKQKFKYGYIEFRAQWPTFGKGMFPALWMFASDGSTDALNKGSAEIDIMEIFGIHDIWDTTLHEKDNAGTSGPDLHVGTQTSDTDGWHTWGLDWQPTYLKFYYDNTLIYTVTGSDATFYNTNMNILINFAMDAPWFPSGNLSDGTTPSPMIMNVDYVRVYTTKP